MSENKRSQAAQFIDRVRAEAILHNRLEPVVFDSLVKHFKGTRSPLGFYQFPDNSVATPSERIFNAWMLDESQCGSPMTENTTAKTDAEVIAEANKVAMAVRANAASNGHGRPMPYSRKALNQFADRFDDLAARLRAADAERDRMRELIVRATKVFSKMGLHSSDQRYKLMDDFSAALAAPEAKAESEGGR